MKDIPLALIAYGMMLLILSCGQNHKSGPGTQPIPSGWSEDPAKGPPRKQSPTSRQAIISKPGIPSPSGTSNYLKIEFL
jgi:hypothetical protein